MRAIAVVALLALGACAAASGSTASASSEMRDWQTPTGKPPTKAEFAALVAACQDKVKTTTESGPFDGCLADLGLRRTP
jgi:ABC-type glycerol-3-phosphate transport system substrate-binding protein